MTGIVAVVALTAGFVTEVTGGRLTGPASTTFTGVSIDSRTVGAGNLFVAIRGEILDGHAFVDQAIQKGAAGVLVSTDVRVSGNAAVVEVPHTVVALQALGRAVRRQSAAKVVAITGSAGKTTTKELIADVLSARYRVMRNRGNLNNHIGLPLSLTELATGPEIAVVELGMNHAGEIRTLVGLAEPDVRVWTNVGDAHIGYFGSREMVARAKAEILELAGRDAVAVLNADDPLVREHAQEFSGQTITFGVHESADVRARSIVDSGFDGLEAAIETSAGRFTIKSNLPGQAHLMNALAATAVGVHFGVPLAEIAARIDSAQPVPRRGSQAALSNGVRLVDDSYNASPAAVTAMLQTMAATPVTGRRVAVLGEMLELGDSAVALHESCGRAAARAGVDWLVAVGGPAADGLIAGAVAEGIPADRTRRYKDSQSASAPVVDLVRSGDLVLVKGSRGTRTDVIADALKAAGGQ